MHQSAFLMNENSLACDLAFCYRVHRPRPETSQVIVALHGSGVDETTILPLAARILPDALVIAPRGRIIQNSERRWYEKITPTLFDQESVRMEAAAFAGFIEDLRDAGMIEPKHTLFLGYSNGANLIAATMLLHPGLIQRGALLRSMPVLLEPPSPDLTGTRALVVAGKNDATYGPLAPSLSVLLTERGAATESVIVNAGHEFGENDCAAVQAWLHRDPGWSGSQVALTGKHR
ncbi:MAG: alpha/beta hydrolase [Rhizobiaceae bacterium]